MQHLTAAPCGLVLKVELVTSCFLSTGSLLRKLMQKNPLYCIIISLCLPWSNSYTDKTQQSKTNTAKTLKAFEDNNLRQEPKLFTVSV